MVVEEAELNRSASWAESRSCERDWADFVRVFALVERNHRDRAWDQPARSAGSLGYGRKNVGRAGATRWSANRRSTSAASECSS